MSPESERQPTPIDHIADAYFDEVVENSPLYMTELGIDKRQDEYDDLSPEGLQDQRDRSARALAELAGEQPADAVDSVTVAAMRERLGLEIDLHDAGYSLLSLNGITSGLHTIREAYDQMPHDTAEQWATIGRRMRAVPRAIDQWFATQDEAIRRGVVPARRQVELLIEQTHQWTGKNGYFDDFSAEAHHNPAVDDSLAATVDESMAVARQAFSDAADRLGTEFLGRSTDVDGVGKQRYQLASREFTGTTIDLAETYEWGLAEVERLTAREQETAEKIRPGATIAEAMAILDADPHYLIHGTDALKEWMQEQADDAIARLDGVHFDIPEPVRRIEACIAPTKDGGIYYTAPSEDFSRPGRMWWSVPDGLDTFTTWRELTTVHHEGVPGHHLQIGQTAALGNALNRWRKYGCWVSGHGEGWALYAERLMVELGLMDDPGDLMGVLDSHMLRAVRVGIDIGVHCGFQAPAELGGGTWTFEKAWEYFNRHVSMNEGMARYEVNRYFGWPGQAPAYLLGEREWVSLREQVRQALGDQFSLKDFHKTALDIGSVGLDVLRAAVLDALVG